MAKKTILTFGEIMLRISPDHAGERVDQSSLFRIEPGGSESNVAIALGKLGNDVGFMTKLPDASPHSEIILRHLKENNVSCSHVSAGVERLGLYWTEKGIGPRASRVFYDRQGSSFSKFKVKDFNWANALKNAGWFHTSGITPALTETSSKSMDEILRMLNKKVKVSMDLNYRSKLWTWVKGNRKEKIKKIMRGLCSNAYMIAGNESDLQDALGYSIPNIFDEHESKIILEGIFHDFPNLNYLGISLRDSHSATENDWSGLLLVREKNKIKAFNGPKYQLNNIMDRVGTGDSFSAGLIHGIINFNKKPQRIIDFATTLSALNHTVIGDASPFTVEDVEQAMKTKGSGRIIR